MNYARLQRRDNPAECDFCMGNVGATGVSEASSPVTRRHRRRRLEFGWPLIAVLVLALAVRLWTIDWGLPYVYDPDEPLVLSATVHMLKRGDPNPHWFHYPSLVFYLHGGILAVGAWIASGFSSSGFIDSLTYPDVTAMGSALLESKWTLFVPRLVTAMLSVATAGLVYAVVRRVTQRRIGAVFAGLLMALIPLVVREARQFAPDTIAMFATAGVIWGSLRLYHEGSTKNYVIAGALVGLAAGSKYNAVLSAAMVVAAHFLRADRSPGLLNRRLLMSGYVTVLVFLLTTPYAILDWPRFTNDVGWALYRYSTGHPGLEGNGLLYIAMIGGSFSLSLLFLPFAAIYRTTRVVTWIVGGFALGYVLFLSRYPLPLEHNLLPSMPAFAVVIGLGFSAALSMVQNRRLAKTVVLSVSALTLMLATAGLVAEYNKLEDRREAVEWIKRQLPRGSTILVEAYSPWIDSDQFRVRSVNFVAQDELPPEWDYVVITERGSGRFVRQPGEYPVEAQVIAEIRGSTCPMASFSGQIEIRSSTC